MCLDRGAGQGVQRCSEVRLFLIPIGVTVGEFVENVTLQFCLAPPDPWT